ncbi:hypothetical protein JCM8547_005963 [Rhodosporidiobolus lusitaniae]
MARRYNQSEPRRASAAVPYKYQSNDSNVADLACMASMACSGAAMLTRFAGWPWLALIFAISSILGEKKLGTNKKTGEQGGMLSGYSALLFAGTSFFSIYMPLLTGGAMKNDIVNPFGFNSGTIPIPKAAPVA